MLGVEFHAPHRLLRAVCTVHGENRLQESCSERPFPCSVPSRYPLCRVLLQHDSVLYPATPLETGVERSTKIVTMVFCLGDGGGLDSQGPGLEERSWEGGSLP